MTIVIILSAVILLFIFFLVLSKYRKEVHTYATIKMILWEYFFVAAMRFFIGGLPGGLGVFLRMFFYPPMFKKIGRKVTIFENVIFDSPQNIVIGDYSHIGHYCYISGWGGITIGSWVRIGKGACLITSEHNSDDVNIPMKKQGITLKPIIIGDDVWIGVNTLVMPGVRIGKGSIISSGSVVFMDIPEYSVVAGNPARVVRNRKVPLTGK